MATNCKFDTQHASVYCLFLDACAVYCLKCYGQVGIVIPACGIIVVPGTGEWDLSGEGERDRWPCVSISVSNMHKS
jgi:hypothetical protein